MPQRKTTPRVRSSSKRKRAIPAAPDQALHCHPPDGHRGNPPASFRGAAPSFALVAIMTIVLYSFFSVVQAQSLMKKESPQCNGFVACTQLFFGNLWRTITGNPTSPSLAQAPGNPEGQATGQIIQPGTTNLEEISVGPVPYGADAGGNGGMQGGHSLVLQPMGMDNVVIGSGQSSPEYKLDVFGGGIRADRLNVNNLFVTGIANVQSVSASLSIATPMLCLGTSPCLDNINDFGPWKKVADTTTNIKYTGGKVIVGSDKFVVDTDGNVTAGIWKGTPINSSEIADATIQNSDLSLGSFPKITGVGALGSLLVSNLGFIATDENPTDSPNAKAILEMKSGDKGFLPPRMTTAQMNAISGPPEGLTIYNTASDKHQYQVWNGNEWDTMGGVWKKTSPTSTDIYYSSGKIGIDTTTPTAKLSISTLEPYKERWFEAGCYSTKTYILYHTDLNAICGTDDATSDGEWFAEGCTNATYKTKESCERIKYRSATASTAIDIGDTSAAWRFMTSGGAAENGKLQIKPVKFDSNGIPIEKSSDKGITIQNMGGSDAQSVRVGINTKNPLYELDVAGDINVKTAMNKTHDALAYASERVGLDVAELFESEEEVEVGDVLIIGSNERKLKKASAPYQNKIIGVVSGSPAILFEGDEMKLSPKKDRFVKGTKPPVALAGRVPVKVSLENGLIMIGDYLTSSSTPGVAMKATEPGTTIGIALENYYGWGEGHVLTFINIGEKNTSSSLQKLQDRIDQLEKRLR